MHQARIAHHRTAFAATMLLVPATLGGILLGSATAHGAGAQRQRPAFTVVADGSAGAPAGTPTGAPGSGGPGGGSDPHDGGGVAPDSHAWD